MSEQTRESQLEDIHGQLEEWQENLAVRVAGEAHALDAELDKLYDHEFEEVWDTLRTARERLYATTDMLRAIRQRIQDRHPIS